MCFHVYLNVQRNLCFLTVLSGILAELKLKEEKKKRSTGIWSLHVENVNIQQKLKSLTPDLFEEVCFGLVNNPGLPRTNRLLSLWWPVITSTHKSLELIWLHRDEEQETRQSSCCHWFSVKEQIIITTMIILLLLLI